MNPPIKLSSLFSPPSQNTDNSYLLTVQSNRCGEIVPARANLNSGLMAIMTRRAKSGVITAARC
jgi:hypothetical protein